MSHSRYHSGMRSHNCKSLNYLQSGRSLDRSMNWSLTSHASYATSSKTHINHGRSQQTGTPRSNSDFNRYSENKNQSSYMRDSGRRSSFNEQARTSSANTNINSNNNHCIDRKRASTTFNTTSDSPPIKRPCLPPVSYPTLIQLFDKSSDDILTEMLHPNFQLKKFLTDKRMRERYDWIFSMTRLLEKITQCIGSRERILMIFEQLPDTRYLEGVYDEIRKLDPYTNQLRFKFIELFLKISNTFLAMKPHSADGLAKLFERIELQFTKHKSESREFEDTRRILDEVLKRVKDIENQEQRRQELLNLKSFNTMNIQYEIGQSPNHHRRLPIVPDIMEILSEQQPYLRKNIIDGTYENAEQYLDIHFRLLREDFVGPLRDGIQHYLSKTKGKNFNVRIYENVTLLGLRLSPRNGLVYDLRLDATVASKTFWANSRRLMYGNLLLLTFDNFQSCVFVTIEDRSQIEKQFIISVKTLEKLNNYQQTQINLDKIDFSRSLTMIETMTYFEAYRPVLSALQIIPSDHRFPLGLFLLKLTKEMVPPDYIKPTTTYDFTPLLVDSNSDIQSNIIFTQTRPGFPISVTVRINYKQSNQIEEKYKKVSILNKDEWPTSEQLHLNSKQREALMLALTNKVALIQGPPGTGKTFLGVRITEMLLHNGSIWCPPNQQSTPILMICHTNHALDQFLELIVKRLNINEGLIRVGNRCQNLTIQQFSLINARQRAREYHSIPGSIYRAKHTVLEKKAEIEIFLKSQQYKMEMSRIRIMPLSSFTEYSIIDHRHYTSLLAPYNHDIAATALLQWLCLSNGFEQIFDDIIYKENPTINISAMEINDNIQEKIEDQQDELNEEEEEEEERRRRDELDMEEYEYFVPSAVQKLETTILTDIEIRSKDDSNRGKILQTVKEEPNNIHQLIQYIVQNPTTLDDQTVQQINDDVWQLPIDQRYNLYRYWLLKYRQYINDSLYYGKREYNQVISNLDKCRQDEDYHLLKDSVIIAMTTTCAAKYQKVLQKLQSKIVIVEEAAAIFEAHIITALSTKCEHLILIGDHVQLRPNPSVYRLGFKYNIDVSLFERLIKNNFPNVRLNIQHRMRPEIARLMKHFYDDLDDHISVKTDRAQIRGINSNVFFINHNHFETTIDNESSKRNEFEAKYAIELAQYLIKQGYKSKQITILVMYLGQRQFIAKLAKEKNLLHGVRIMVTDNYQGEENDIIILSLVRSNPEKNIGFLKVHNRVCVALSRARCGLFVIGNMNLLAEVDDLWKNIIASLVETNNIGNGLSLCCRQHSNNTLIADKPESFAQCPTGGCSKPCDARLKCSHRCELRCHSYDFEHENVVCHKKCDERLSCGHSCTKQCHVETPNQHNPCHVLVEKTIPECGHKIRIECCKMPTTNDCKKSSSKRLACNHIVDVPCRIIALPDKLKRFRCPKPCNTILACQHKCIGTCGNCCTGKLHVACDEKCERELICSHVCKAPCATNCPPCLRECETRCKHSQCKKKCGDLCIPCREPCVYKCKHFQCTRLCSEPCNRGACNESCDKKLKCGHNCIGLCGEPCPRECRICDKHFVQDILFGSEDEPDAHFVLLPDCNHIIEATALDKYMEDFVNNSNDKRAIRFPECPRCKQKVYRCTRYMTIINQVHNLISQVKKKILGNQTEQERNDRREQLITEYEKMQKNLKEIHFDYSINNFLQLISEYIKMQKSLKQIQFYYSIHKFFSVLYKKNHFFTDDMLNLITNVIEFLNEIDQILIDGRKKLQGNIFEDFVIFPLRHIVKYLFTQRHSRNFAEQQLKDIQAEIERIRRVIYIETLIFSLKRILEENEKEGIDSMQDLTRKPGPFTDQDRQKFDDLVKKFNYLNNLSGLGITENERKAIVSALNMKKGHWHVCPNGHPYVITECGGANQESQCPDCGERIGGQNHRLLPTNRHFGLMDDSQYAAWSNEANLNLP